jgi:hypothetical protein
VLIGIALIVNVILTTAQSTSVRHGG